MRIKLPQPVRHYDGERRIKSGFLWYPWSINGDFRWLEKATWEEVCWVGRSGGVYWETIRWIDNIVKE